ncbi:Kinesin-like protein [Phytophthora cactorum]|nr:Kinesin-like protein [Phytophthora cactorum]
MVMQSVLPATPQRVLHTTIAHVSKPSASGAHTYTQYLVRVSDERSPGLNWTVYRRYSEFRIFKIALEEAIKRGDMCAHCAIMSKRTCFVLFPHRRLFGNLREKTLEARRIGLNTRPLMDKFLMVNDMRYTYLNVDMSEASGTDRSSKVSVGEKHSTDRLSGYSDYREEGVRSCTEEWTHTDCDELTNPATDPKADQPQEEASTTKNAAQQDESGLAVKPRQSLTSEWERSAYKQPPPSTSTSRHSDPGLARNELLNFTRGSFSGAGVRTGRGPAALTQGALVVSR